MHFQSPHVDVARKQRVSLYATCVSRNNIFEVPVPQIVRFSLQVLQLVLWLALLSLLTHPQPSSSVISNLR